jgi:hypothetical protein
MCVDKCIYIYNQRALQMTKKGERKKNDRALFRMYVNAKEENKTEQI